MSLKGLADLSTLTKTFYSIVVGASVLLGSIYVFASSYFVNIDKFSPVASSVKDNATQIKNLLILLDDTVQVREFKQYTYEKDIADANERIKQFDRAKQSRELTIYETSQVEYLTDSITRWRTALEGLSQ